ncbi:iron-sulfur cluster biosynthesis family protein [Ligilactobacillus aviarius]|uniref:iron-sulfur cluster biosynthesis family protein n=1 Tax=Ligilactobacillus aviarius TaxID=1606 RepID=UPI0024BA3F48|nr:iron-sulfur cluster biosynthesis family protein [Ligilactobacillus aviarius]
MELKITDEAQAKLKPYFDDPNAVVLLDFDDGVGYRPEEAISCTLNQEFRLLIVRKDRDYHEYNAKLPTVLGDFYYKDYSKSFMDEEMTIVVNSYQQLTLKGKYRGQLTPVLNVLDLRNE